MQRVSDNLTAARQVLSQLFERPVLAAVFFGYTVQPKDVIRCRSFCLRYVSVAQSLQ